MGDVAAIVLSTVLMFGIWYALAVCWNPEPEPSAFARLGATVALSTAVVSIHRVAIEAALAFGEYEAGVRRIGEVLEGSSQARFEEWRDHDS